MKKISLSFKENEDYILEHIKKHLNYSVYLKELVLKDMEKSCEPEKKPINNKSNNGIEW